MASAQLPYFRNRRSAGFPNVPVADGQNTFVGVVGGCRSYADQAFSAGHSATQEPGQFSLSLLSLLPTPSWLVFAK